MAGDQGRPKVAKLDSPTIRTTLFVFLIIQMRTIMRPKNEDIFCVKVIIVLMLN